MNFVRYDPQTGVITSMGWGRAESVQEEIDQGLPTLAVDQVIEWGKWQVNLETKQIEPIPEPPAPTE